MESAEYHKLAFCWSRFARGYGSSPVTWALGDSSRTFVNYRLNLKTGIYQVQLNRSIKEALYTPRSILLLDHNWHDIVYDDLLDWVKQKQTSLESGEELKGRMFRYRLNRSNGKYQIKLRSRLKEAYYSILSF